ncbi:MAG: SGNH/GDSL hydrolase family protein [Candidatus Obscuribacterales bacterium]|nr:SGNH/GDSL hydrolase family protein [Candidatus Obscuribacterales bacterium]
MPPISTTSKSLTHQTALETTQPVKPKRIAFALGRVLKATIYGFFSFGVMLLLIEGFLALNHIGEQEYLKVDPAIGFAHLENKLVTDRSESLGIDKINSSGLTDTEHGFTKTPGTVRIAILGDSITEALQLPIKERFARVLESKLNAKSTQNFEVINFGVGGFGTGHEYLQFVRDVRRYQPDQVILMYHQGDETENSPDGSKWSLQPTFTLNDANAPQIRYQEFDTWRHSSSAAPLTFFDWGRRNSHIWQCLLQTHSSLKNEALYKRVTELCTKISKGTQKILCNLSPDFKRAIAAKSNREEQSTNADRQRLLKDAHLLNDVQVAPSQYDAPQQWLLTQKLIELLNEECHRHNIKLLIAFVPALEKPISSRLDFSKKIEELQKLGKKDGFETLNLSTKFYAAEKETSKPIILLAHLSPRGHELVADAISTYYLSKR